MNRLRYGATIFSTVLAMNRGSGLLGKIFLYSPFFSAFEGKLHEEKLNADDCFDVM